MRRVMESLPLRTRLYLQPRDAEVRASDLEIVGPSLYQGPRPPGAASHAPLYECVARFPGVLPEDGFVRRGYSTLEAMLGVISSTEAFCREFQKAGGRIY